MPNKKRIAIVSPTQSEENRSLLTGLSRCDAAQNWDTFIDSNCRSVSDPDWLFSNRWDGIVYNHRDRKLIEIAEQKGIPCVDINDESDSIPGTPKVRPDNEEAGKMAADYLKALGFSRFAFCGYSNQVWSNERKTGFQKTLHTKQQTCLSFETEHPVGTNHPSAIVLPDWEIHQVNDIAKWLKGVSVPIAIFACDDTRSAQVSRAASLCGLQTPSEIAILGANNETFLCEMEKPSLSSIDLNGIQRGTKAATILNTMMLPNFEYDLSTLRIRPLEVVSRQSTNASAFDDKIISKAIAIIQAESCKGLRVTDLVKRVHTSRRLLERKFQQHLGLSPNKAIRDAQVSKIKGLINHTDKSLTEIAYETGFSHPEYMNVVFKRVSGMTPGNYRNKVSSKS